MQNRILTYATLKYWHLDTNIAVFFNLLPSIVVIIVTLEQLLLAVTLYVFVQKFLIFVCIFTNEAYQLRMFMNVLVFL